MNWTVGRKRVAAGDEEMLLLTYLSDVAVVLVPCHKMFQPSLLRYG